MFFLKKKKRFLETLTVVYDIVPNYCAFFFKSKSLLHFYRLTQLFWSNVFLHVDLFDAFNAANK